MIQRKIIEKFFKKYKEWEKIDIDEIKGWYMNETNFQYNNADLYNFLTAIKFFCSKETKSLFIINKKNVEKFLGGK